MPRDDKKITLDDILAEYHSHKNTSDMEISEEISIDDDDTDDIEIVQETFVGPEPEHTWEEIGAEELPILSDTYDGKSVDLGDAAAVLSQFDDDGRDGQDNKDSHDKKDDRDKKVGRNKEDNRDEKDVRNKEKNLDKADSLKSGHTRSDIVKHDDKRSEGDKDSKTKPESSKSSTAEDKERSGADNKRSDNAKTGKPAGSDGTEKSAGSRTVEKSAGGKTVEKSAESKTEDKSDVNKTAVKMSESETAEKNTVSETMEISDDINDIWLARFAKSIFPVKGDSVGEIIRKIVFLVAVIVFIGAGIMLISTLIQSDEAKDIQESNQSVIVTTVATIIGSDGNVVTIPPTPEEIAEHNLNVAEYYKEINEDYVGYLEIPGCDIYEPVVQGDDNEYYLKTKISGGYNKAGTIFMDYRCSLTDEYTSPNIVIYGHNQEDGTMFGRLKYYKQDVPFYQENPVVRFSTETETNEYLVYGFFVTHVYEKQDSNGIVFHYHDYIDQINDEETFNWYLDEIQKRNQIISPVDVQYGDQLLCLSTCSNEFTDSRFVVFARKLRDGESVADYDFSTARLNPYAQGVDWDAIMSGFTSDEEDENDPSEEELSEVVTSEKSLNKRNVRTETTAKETEAPVEETEVTTVTTVPPETEVTSETVIPSESSDTGTETVPDGNESSDVSETESGSEDSSETGDSEAGDSGSGNSETEVSGAEDGSGSEVSS